MKKTGEPECAHCNWIVSGKQGYFGELPGNLFNGKKWSEIEGTGVILPSVESGAPLIAYAINACHKMNCNSDTGKFLVKIDSFQAIGELLKPKPNGGNE